METNQELKIVMSPSTVAEIDTIMKYIKKMRLHVDNLDPKIGSLVRNKNLSVKSKNEFWEPQNLHVVSNEELKVGDYCMFYNQLSKVLEINGSSAKISTNSILDKEDADFMNRILGKEVYKEGEIGKMTHSFSKSQLPKIVSTTDPELILYGVSKMDDLVVLDYIIEYNKKV